jgi:hypothetical protein
MNGPADVMIQTEGNHEMDKTGQGTLTVLGIDGRSSRLYIILSGWFQPEFQTKRRKCLQRRSI